MSGSGFRRSGHHRLSQHVGLGSWSALSSMVSFEPAPLNPKRCIVLCYTMFYYPIASYISSMSYNIVSCLYYDTLFYSILYLFIL